MDIIHSQEYTFMCIFYSYAENMKFIFSIKSIHNGVMGRWTMDVSASNLGNFFQMYNICNIFKT